MKLSHWLIATATLLLPGCSDRQTLPTEARPPASSPALVALECRADVRARAVRCADAAGGGDARALIMGGQNALVRLASSAVSYDSATGVFSVDETIENLLDQALGTADGVSTDPEGIRVFFHAGPVVTAGSGQAVVANPDGTGTFTASGQPYFRYPGMLAPHDTTAAKTWRFQLDQGVVAFAFRLFLDVRVEPRLVITEIMAHPATADEAAGEWFEVYNAGRVQIDLDGYAIASGGDAGYTIAGPLVLLAGQYAVLGGSADTVANGGLAVRQVYTGVTLGNDAADWLALRAPTGVALDSVSWGAAAGDVPAAPPVGTARALVSPDSPNVNLSGARAPWIGAVGTYGPGLWRGTPGAANPLGARGGISIAAGTNHVCMADRDGAAWCWGFGGWGQLGNGAGISSATRLRVAAPAGVRFGRVAARWVVSCALAFTGEAYCWGGNVYGDYPFVYDVLAPQQFPNPGTSLITAVVPGPYSYDNAQNDIGFCQVDGAGEVFCWRSIAAIYYPGWTRLSALAPAALTFSQVAVGFNFACALANGRVYCYGRNGLGELGDGTTSPRPTLVEVHLPQGVAFRSVAATRQTACALSEAGQAYCWGQNWSGQLGIGAADRDPHPLPVAVQQPAGVAFTSLSLGDWEPKRGTAACGLTAAGQAWCWGDNFAGHLGDGTNTQRLVPTPVVQRGVRFSAITVGGEVTCALEEDTGQPFCWGSNAFGEVGDGSSVERWLPVPVR
jgi:hypothetical protein